MIRSIEKILPGRFWLPNLRLVLFALVALSAAARSQERSEHERVRDKERLSAGAGGEEAKPLLFDDSTLQMNAEFGIESGANMIDGNLKLKQSVAEGVQAMLKFELIDRNKRVIGGGYIA